jgi:hypothetical protein
MVIARAPGLDNNYDPFEPKPEHVEVWCVAPDPVAEVGGIAQVTGDPNNPGSGHGHVTGTGMPPQSPQGKGELG